MPPKIHINSSSLHPSKCRTYTYKVGNLYIATAVPPFLFQLGFKKIIVEINFVLTLNTSVLRQGIKITILYYRTDQN